MADLLKHGELTEPAVFLFLGLDVLPNERLVRPTVESKFPLTQKCCPVKSRFAASEGSCNLDGTLALDETDHLCDGIFRWNRKERANMVPHEMPFQYASLPLLRQFPDNPSQVLSQVPEQDLISVFRNPYKVVLAIPHRVA